MCAVFLCAPGDNPHDMSRLIFSEKKKLVQIFVCDFFQCKPGDIIPNLCESEEEEAHAYQACSMLTLPAFFPCFPKVSILNLFLLGFYIPVSNLSVIA